MRAANRLAHLVVVAAAAADGRITSRRCRNSTADDAELRLITTSLRRLAAKRVLYLLIQ